MGQGLNLIAIYYLIGGIIFVCAIVNIRYKNKNKK